MARMAIKNGGPKTALSLIITSVLNNWHSSKVCFYMPLYLRKLSYITSIPGDVLSEGGLGLKNCLAVKSLSTDCFFFCFFCDCRWIQIPLNVLFFRAVLLKSSFTIAKRQLRILQNWLLSVLRFIYSAVRVLCDRVGVHMGETSLLAFTKPYGGMRLFRIICTTLHTRIYGKQGRR